MPETTSIAELREAQDEAFKRLREYEEHLITLNGFKDPYGRDNYRYNQAKSSDPRHGQLFAEFKQARAAYEAARAGGNA